jgi:hypothetical protein
MQRVPEPAKLVEQRLPPADLKRLVWHPVAASISAQPFLLQDPAARARNSTSFIRLAAVLRVFVVWM